MSPAADGTPVAIVLVSGGLDSATVLAMAREEGRVCHGLSFYYGQRHEAELLAARRICEALGAASHRTMGIDFGGLGGSALTDTNIAVPEAPGEGIPVTYVPARNTVFLSLALGAAEVLGASEIYIGVNARDYSGYPDCRPAYIEAFQAMANLATKTAVEGRPILIRAPLINLGKGEIIRKGVSLGVDYARTVSCYQPDEQGRACGRCDSCRLRKEGFEAAGEADPTRYQA